MKLKYLKFPNTETGDKSNDVSTICSTSALMVKVAGEQGGGVVKVVVRVAFFHQLPTACVCVVFRLFSDDTDNDMDPIVIRDINA